MKAVQGNWFVARISSKTIELRHGEKRVLLGLHWTDLTVRNGGTKFEALASKLGISEYIQKSREEAKEGVLYGYDVRKLKSVSVNSGVNRQVANQCESSGRIEQLASLVGPELHWFEFYDDNDHADPKGSNPFDEEMLFTGPGNEVDLSLIQCETPAESYSGNVAQERLSVLLTSERLKGFSINEANLIGLEFHRAFGETFQVDVALDESGVVSSIETRVHNHGRHGRTYYKNQVELAQWASQGDVIGVKVEQGGLVLRNELWTDFEVTSEYLCCLAAEGEESGHEICSQKKYYDLQYICGGRQGPGWQE